MTIEKFTKQPADDLDYDVDASEWMVPGDQISSIEVTADPGITIGTTSFNVNTHVVKVWLSGGTDGAIYKVTVKITTAQGRVKESEFKLKVKEI